MLHRVSSALNKFIRPVSVAQRSPKTQDRSQEEHPSFQRFDHSGSQSQSQSHSEQEKNEARAPQLRVVSEDDPSVQSPPPQPSVSTSFIELISSIRQKGDHLSKWLASRSYSRSIKKQKRDGQFKKGTMMDEEAP